MNESTPRPQEPMVDDLLVKHCYICLEEERHDGRPNPPPIWTHPCKCTLIAHESCLLHWVNTQQRNFGRSRSELRCPQCRELYEFVDHNLTFLRVLKFANRALFHSGRIVTGIYVGTTVVLLGVGVYAIFTTYGAFAVREFLGPDMFNMLLTTDPSRWPRHAWVNLPLIPFSLVAANSSPLLPFLWTTSPLVSLLSPWPTSAPVASHVVHGAGAHRLPMWPPPPALVCALFPFVRTMYGHLRDRVTRALVPDQGPARQEPIWRQQQQPRQLRQLAPRRQDQLRWVVQQERPQRWQHQHQQLPPQQPQEQQPNHDGFAAVAAARAASCVTDASIGHLVGGALAIPMIARLMGDILLRISHVVPLVRIIIAPRPPLPPVAVAVGGLVGLWGRARSAFRLFSGAGSADVAVVAGGYGGWLGGFGTKVLAGLLVTTQEWAMSDPVWWRNALGLGLFFVVKDGLKILNLRLANTQLEERKIRNRPFHGVNLTRLDLIERHA